MSPIIEVSIEREIRSFLEKRGVRKAFVDVENRDLILSKGRGGSHYREEYWGYYTKHYKPSEKEMLTLSFKRYWDEALAQTQHETRIPLAIQENPWTGEPTLLAEDQGTPTIAALTPSNPNNRAGLTSSETIPIAVSHDSAEKIREAERHAT